MRCSTRPPPAPLAEAVVRLGGDFGKKMGPRLHNSMDGPACPLVTTTVGCEPRTHLEAIEKIRLRLY